jgi:tetratricopeptide (TPR) repeat protein
MPGRESHVADTMPAICPVLLRIAHCQGRGMINFSEMAVDGIGSTIFVLLKVTRKFRVTRMRLALVVLIAVMFIAAPAHICAQEMQSVSSSSPLQVTAGKRKRAEQVVREGLRKAAQGDYKKAISDYNRALTLDPQNATAYFYRGVAHSHLGDDRAAAEDFEQTVRLRIEKLDRIIRQHPGDASAHVQRGFARSEYRDLQGAIDDYTQAIRLDPQNADAYYYRGNVYYKQGQKQAAINEYDQVLRIDPKRADVYVTRAALRLELGDRQGAAEDFGQARQINPDDQVTQNSPK